jgi:LysM repeat protein
LDEEREPHFLEGKSRLNARDYKGAAESFEKGLQINPHSAAAHFELALLCQQNRQDYAAAIYHFDRFLELRPRSDYADIVKQRIVTCKQELARTVSLGPVTQSMQREFEQIVEENKRLHEELEACRANLVAFQQTRSNQPAPQLLASRPAPAPTNISRPPAAVTSNSTLAARQTSTAAPLRTHTVKPGDTPTMIARQYGVRVDALMAANPKLDARRMQIGQVLNVPTQ